MAAPIQSASPPSLLLRTLWGGVAKSTQALGWHRYLAVDAIAAATSLVRPGRVAECAVRHRRADPALTAQAARARARASYREYFRTCLDLMWADALTMETVRRDHPMDGWEHIARAEEEHGSGIFCLAHFGNWDMAATMALSRGLPLTTVMRDFSPRFFN